MKLIKVVKAKHRLLCICAMIGSMLRRLESDQILLPCKGIPNAIAVNEAQESYVFVDP